MSKDCPPGPSQSRINFDEPVDRRDTHSLKWNKYKNQDVLPLWVADMDFRAPPEVIRALHERVEHGIFGYAEPGKPLLDRVDTYLATRHNWQVPPEAVVWISAVMPGLNIAVRAMGKPGDAVVMPVPVYHPFLAVANNTDRQHIAVRCVRTANRWEFDFEALEDALKRADAAVIVLCNPHNPLGRVYSRRELETLAALALRYKATICSDEIHCDLILDQTARHIPIASLDPEVAKNTITLMAPSKTFNIPGLNFGFAVITDKTLRQRFTTAYDRFVQPSISPLALAAAEASYQYGQPWLDQMLDYLRANEKLLRTSLAEVSNVRTTLVEATYLAWIDVSRSGVSNLALASHFEKNGLGLSDGNAFDGAGFVRLNFACTNALLQQAIDRFLKAVA